MLNMTALIIGFGIFLSAYLIGVRKKVSFVSAFIPSATKDRILRNKEEFAKTIGLYIFIAGVLVLFMPIFVLLMGAWVGGAVFVVMMVTLVIVLGTKLKQLNEGCEE